MYTINNMHKNKMVNKFGIEVVQDDERIWEERGYIITDDGLLKKMKKYKIEITKTYCIDVLADNKNSAEDMAEKLLDESMLNGTEHYLQTGDTFFTAYDVTNTEDPFNPVK